MILISHRGNLHGPDSNDENKPNYVNSAIKKGFEVEIDVWRVDNSFFLGHDKPQYKINDEFLKNEKLWCHAKNYESFFYMQKMNCHFFWHENDKYTLTSKGYIWAYPGELVNEKSICVMPEKNKIVSEKCAGICSDFISNFK